MKAYQSMRAQTKRLIDEKQAERAELMEKIAQGKKMLSDFQFTDQASIDAYREEIKKVCDDYSEAKRITGNKAASTFAALSLIAAAGLDVYKRQVQSREMSLLTESLRKSFVELQSQFPQSRQKTPE